MSGVAVEFEAHFDEIFDFVADDDLKSAVKRLLDLVKQYADTEHVDEALGLSQQRRMTEDAFRRDDIKVGEYFDLRAKLGRKVVALARAVHEHLEEEASGAR